MAHGSPKWARELAKGEEQQEEKNDDDDGGLKGIMINRIHVPFPKEPVRLIVGWMMAGGGGQGSLGTATEPYPKRIGNLKMLLDLVIYLEIGQLKERIAKDIAAAMSPKLPPPVLPAAAKAMPKTTGTASKTKKEKRTKKVERLCYFCKKDG